MDKNWPAHALVSINVYICLHIYMYMNGVCVCVLLTLWKHRRDFPLPETQTKPRHCPFNKIGSSDLKLSWIWLNFHLCLDSFSLASLLHKIGPCFYLCPTVPLLLVSAFRNSINLSSLGVSVQEGMCAYRWNGCHTTALKGSTISTARTLSYILPYGCHYIPIIKILNWEITMTFIRCS